MLFWFHIHGKYKGDTVNNYEPPLVYMTLASISKYLKLLIYDIT